MQFNTKIELSSSVGLFLLLCIFSPLFKHFHSYKKWEIEYFPTLYLKDLFIYKLIWGSFIESNSNF